MDINESFDAILATNGTFGESFYVRLSSKHPEIVKYFDGIDMARQARLLTTSLLLVAREHTTPNEAIKEYIRVLGTRHSQLKIQEDAYPMWQTSLVAHLADFHGDQWNDELASQWNSALSHAIDLMLVGYTERHHA